MKKTNPLFWLPALISVLSLMAIVFVTLTVFCSSDKYEEDIEKNRMRDAQNAIDLVYKTRKKSDITKAQMAINTLNDSDRKKLSQRLSNLEDYFEKSQKIETNLNQLKKRVTEQNLEKTKQALEALTTSEIQEPHIQKDKKKLEKALNDYYKQYENQLKNKKVIALTFDDGPTPETTPQLLDILDTKKVPVTFFALGENAQKYPEIIAKEAQKGHEVASHTWDHSDLKTLTKEKQKEEILKANQLINKITGQDIALFRPPYGSYDESTLELTPLTTVLWSVDTNDWQYNNSAPVIQNAISSAYDGAILLMHDIHPWSVEAVPTIIDELSKEGYTFVTVSTLLKLQNNNSIKPHTAYFD